MLTAEQTAIIKQTVPMLEAHGETVARRLYERMFEDDPEVKVYFNPAHQIEGTQPRALAKAIVTYAQYVDDPAVMADAMELIAQKHVSLTITPGPYPIVGKHLLAAIREVLGEAATDDVIDAWAAAYGALADLFIAREKQIYTDQEHAYGWTGFQDFVIARHEPASENIMSLYMEPADGQPLAPHVPGQYIGLYATPPDGRTIMRNYSLSNAPGTPYYRISVKREPAPEAGAPAGVFSNYLHDHLQVGDRVQLTPPCGNFTLDLPQDEHNPLVFIAGGVGVTPLLSMLYSALEKSAGLRPVVFIQGTLNGAVHAFAEELRTLKTKYPNLCAHVRYSAPTANDRKQSCHDSEGLIDEALLDSLVEDNPATYYFCGPMPMLQHIQRILRHRSVPAQDVRYEFFGPTEQLAT